MTADTRRVVAAIWQRRMCLSCIAAATGISPRGVAVEIATVSEAHLVTTYDGHCARCERAGLVFRASSVTAVPARPLEVECPGSSAA
jgi:hypothetical protein